MATFPSLSLVAGSVAGPPALFGPAFGFGAVGLVLSLLPVAGMAVAGDDDAIEGLIGKIRTVIDGDDSVDFSTDRDDTIGDLYEAVDDLVAAGVDASPRDEQYRQRIYEVAADPDLDREETIDRLLALGRERLDVSVGCLTRIDEDSGRYKIERATDGGFVTEGTVTDLSETFCERTITSDEALGIYDASADGYEDDPAATEWDIHCYLGSKLVVDDDLYGTLCFVDQSPRKRPFTHAEKSFVDLLGRWVSQLLERRQHLSELERDSSLLDSLFEQLPVSIYVKDEEARHLRKSTPDRGGPRPDDDEWYVGKTDLELYPEEYARETYEDDMSVIESGEPILGKVEHDTRAGEWLVTSKVPWRGDDGEVRGLIGISQYITERKEREQTLEAIVENTDTPIYIKDLDGVYQFANEATADVFGIEPGEVVGKRDHELFDPDTIAGALADDQQVVETGESVRSETTLTVDGEGRVYINDKYPYRNQNGEIVGIMGISRDITERKERERELRERERELSTLIANIPGIVYRCRNEPDWPFDFVSEGARSLLGYEPSELVDGEVTWASDVLLEDNDALWAHVQQAIDDRERFQVTYRAETAAGEQRWLWEQGTGVYDEDGTVDGLEGVILDITERKRTEQALRDTNERLNAVIEAAPNAIVAIDTDGAVELWNRAAAQIFGWTAEDVMGERLPFVPEDRREEFEALNEQLLSGDPVSGFETKRLTADGERLDVSLSAAPLRDADGTVTGIMAVIEDISDRKRQERQLRERERELARYREFTEDILEAIDDVFYVLDETGHMERWNSALLDVTGYSDTEVASTHATDFFAPEDRDRIADAMETVRETGEAVTEAPYLTKQGEQIPHEFSAVAIENPEGDRVIAGIGRDISERKRRERELERTTDLLGRAEEMADIGGWATTVVDGELASAEWTDKQYELFGRSPDEEPLTMGVLELLHPDDRDRHREAIDRAIDLGVGWDQELRIRTEDGTQRWVHNIGEPVLEDGEVVEIRGAMQDITGQKERELALEALQDATRELLTVESTDAATGLVVDTAASVLDVSAVGIYRYDEAANALEPSALSDGFEAYRTADDSLGPSSDSFLWHAYVTGTLNVVDGPDVPEGGDIFTSEITTRIAVPIGGHGVFVAIDGGSVSDSARSLAETLVATTEAALDRLESEREVREREAEIESQNERLKRQVRINETIRSVDRSLIGATSRSALEAEVCDRLVEGSDIAFAWIGGFEADGESVQPRAWAGTGESYLDTVSFEGAAASEPAAEVAATGEAHVVSNIARNVQREDWRQAALAAEFQSMLAVPIEFDGYSYGVLAVYAGAPEAFGDLELTVFTELGESIANAATSISTRRALHADTVTALELRLPDSTDLLAEIASETGCTIEYEGFSTVSSEQDRLFVRTSGCDLATVCSLLDRRHTIDDYQVVTEGEDGSGALLELSVRAETLVARLVQHGGRPRAITADSSGITVEVDVPVSTDVRSFVETLAPSGTAELVSRRERTRSLQASRDLVETILSELTDRQREVIRTAYLAGFFNWPRDTSGSELAEMLDVSQPTVNRHLRLAQQQIMQQLFDRDTGPE